MEVGNEDAWKTLLTENRLSSPFSRLFTFCYNRRSRKSEYSIGGSRCSKIGLTTWGNQSYDDLCSREFSYEDNVHIQNLTGAQEDSNDLVNMGLWHPKYLDEYLRYLALIIPGYGRESLQNDRLAELSIEEGRELRNLVIEYISGARNIVKRGR